MKIFQYAAHLSSMGQIAPFVSFVALLTGFTFIFDDFFPLPGYRLGHDYALGVAGLLDGLIWFRNNGFAAPWFSPSFCAGVPFFADPQSGYYSLMQFLALLVNPLLASFLTLLISATLAFWGTYLLLRRLFAADRASAILAGGLLMFNAFIPQRMIIGHLGYHGLALLPWIALVLLWPARSRLEGIILGITAAFLLAYLVHSGMGTILIPAGITIFIIALIFVSKPAQLLGFLTRCLLAVSGALLLSASKLVAGMATMSNFPRDFYPLPGIQSWFDSLMVVSAALFLPSETVQRIAAPRLANLQWALDPHEWAFGFTGAAALLLIVLIVHHRKALRLPQTSFAWLRFLLLSACLLWPLAFITYSPDWNAFLKTLPILRSTSTPTRWLIIFIPPLAIGIGLMLARARWSPQIKAGIAFATLCAVVTLTAIEPRGFYRGQHYDARVGLLADAAIRAEQMQPAIGQIGTHAELRSGSQRLPLGGNDSFLGGVSQLYCYNPLFGYRLEKLNFSNIHPGPALEARNGYLNLKNPVCYVFPEENHCAPGDLFRANQIEAAQRFVNYRPFAFHKSYAQEIADLLTTLALSLLTPLLIGYAAFRLVTNKRHPSRESRGTRSPAP